MTMKEKFDKTRNEIANLEKEIIKLEKDGNFDWSELRSIKIIDDKRFVIKGDDAWFFIHRAFSNMDEKYKTVKIRGLKDELIVSALTKCITDRESKIYHFTSEPLEISFDLDLYKWT